MAERALTIPATDGYPLTARLYEPARGERKGILLINSALAVPMGLYGHFARHASERGYVTLCYDYRGTGGSRAGDLKKLRARHFGQRDMPGVVDFLTKRYPDLPLYVLGHSIGGQLLGLMPNHHRIRRALMVACATGYWRHLHPRLRYPAAFMVCAYIPLMSALLPHVPANRLGLGEDMPAGVAREWASWCRHPGYVASGFGKEIEQHYYEAFSAPMLSIGFDDDIMATRTTIPMLLDMYPNSPKTLRWLSPADSNGESIGHFGFFSRRHHRLWDLALDWLAAPAAADGEAAAVRTA